MTLLLFNCFLNLQASEQDSVPFTGEQFVEDTCISVPIKFIRSANDKMIERKYLLKVTEAQDSIIVLNKKYILQQDTIIDDLQNRILECNRINTDLQNSYKKERNKKIIYGSVAATLAVTTITSVVLIAVMKK